MCCGCRCGERGLEYNIEWGTPRSIKFFDSYGNWLQPAFSQTQFLDIEGTLGGTQENINRSKYGLKSRHFLTWTKFSRTMK